MNKRTFFTAVAVGHLILVAFGIFRLPLLSELNLGGRLARWYGLVTGTAYAYGFFAPEVPPQYKATFTMTDRNGRTWTDTLAHDTNNEVTLRSEVTVSVWGLVGDNLPACWAATMFGRHHDAVLVTVSLNEYNPPTMTDYRAGKRAEWKTIYQATFFRHPQVTTEKQVSP